MSTAAAGSPIGNILQFTSKFTIHTDPMFNAVIGEVGLERTLSRLQNDQSTLPGFVQLCRLHVLMEDNPYIPKVLRYPKIHCRYQKF
jgi:hypothetical protein